MRPALSSIKALATHDNLNQLKVSKIKNSGLQHKSHFQCLVVTVAGGGCAGKRRARTLSALQVVHGQSPLDN
jgi:hypothetical protein